MVAHMGYLFITSYYRQLTVDIKLKLFILKPVLLGEYRGQQSWYQFNDYHLKLSIILCYNT